MNDRQPKTWTLPLATVVVCLLLLASYVISYFALDWGNEDLRGRDFERAYTNRWQAIAYIPAAKVEAAVAGTPVSLWQRSVRTDGLEYSLVYSTEFGFP